MALSKTKKSEYTTILANKGQKRVRRAGISQENISHVLELLTNLYDDPIAATVREVLSNAIDSSVENNTHRPIEITTPTLFSPELRIQDFGCGMSPEKADESFSNYGSSDKSAKLKAVGSYGLGGKAPLAYATSFHVETTHEGVTTKFSMRKANGIVETVFDSVEDTGLPSGTTVTVPVRPADIEDFEKALDVYRKYSFRNKLIIDGEEFSGDDSYLPLGEVLIYEDETDGEKIYGAVHVKKQLLSKIFAALESSTFPASEIHYELGSWVYPADGSRYESSMNDRAVVVEIAPAVVDFSSSRDAITVNDRSRQLNKLVSKSLLNDNAILERAFEIFRDFTHSEIHDFTRSLPKSLMKINTDGNLQIKGYYSIRYTGSPTLLDSKIGINPLMLQSKELPSIVGLTAAFTEEKVKRVGCGKRSIIGTGLTVSEFVKVSEPVSEFVFATANPNAATSISAVAAGVFSGDDSGGSGEQLVLIAGTEANEIKSFVRRRAAISELYLNTKLAFTANGLSSLNKQDLQYAKAILGDRFSVMSSSEFSAIVNVAHREILKNRRVIKKIEERQQVESFITLKRVPAEDLNDSERVIKHAWLGYGNRTERSLTQLIESDSIIFLGNEGSWIHSYIGAVNAQEDILGREIFVMSEKLTAAQLKELYSSMKERVYIARGFKSSAAVGKKFAEERYFHGQTLESTIQRLERDELLENQLYFLGSDDELLSKLSSHFPSDSQIRYYLELRRHHISDEYRKKQTVSLTTADAARQLESAFPEHEDVEITHKLRQAFSQLTDEYIGGFDARLFSSVINRASSYRTKSLDTGGELTKLILKRTAEALNNALTR